MKQQTIAWLWFVLIWAVSFEATSSVSSSSLERVSLFYSVNCKRLILSICFCGITFQLAQNIPDSKDSINGKWWMNVWRHKWIKFLSSKRVKDGEFPDGPVAKTLCSQCRGTGFDLGQGTRFHMPKRRVCMLENSACHSEDQRSPVLQSRFSAAK